MEGLEAYLSQASDHQMVFMQLRTAADLPAHAHAAQLCFVLSGKIQLTIDGKKGQYQKGDIYYIPAGVIHSGKVYAGYADIKFFAESDRYRAKA